LIYLLVSSDIMVNLEHYQKLEHMYLRANVNHEIYDTTTIRITDKQAEIGLIVSPKYFHALGAIHGSVYFKLLDDAAFFAVSAIVEEVFVLTTSFNINILRPVTTGNLRAFGKVKFQSQNLYVAEATLYNELGKPVAFGTGNFARSKILLSEEIGYK